MAKIDLVNNEWVDLIFEGRNQAYGAYKLRKGTSSRNVKSILIMLAMAALAFIAVKVNNVITEANKKVAVTTVQELSALEKPKEKAEVKQKKVEIQQLVLSLQLVFRLHLVILLDDRSGELH